MTRLQWTLQRSAWAAGVPGLVGLALLALAAVVEFGAVIPTTTANAGLRQHIASLRQYPQLAPSVDPALELAGFYDRFPSRSMLSQQVRELHALAERHQVTLGRVDYKLAQVAGTPLQRYRLSYKIVTGYPTLRRYLADVLVKLPNAALENIELQRFNNNTGVPESELNVVLYFRDTP